MSIRATYGVPQHPARVFPAPRIVGGTVPSQLINVRSFDAANDRIQLSIGACNFISGPVAIIALARLTGGSSFRNLIVSELSGAARWTLYTDGNLGFENGSGFTGSSVSFGTSDGWCVIGVSKASGTVTPRFHKLNLGSGVFSHGNGAGTVGNDASAPNELEFAHSDAHGSGFFGYISAGAVWNSIMTDAQFEDIAVRLQDWIDAAPAGAWLLDQASTSDAVNDLSAAGTADKTTESGTAVVQDAIPRFDFTLVSADQEKTASDSGTGSDSTVLVSSLGVTESGTGSETGALTASLSGVDSGSGEDTSSLVATYFLTDTGSGVEVSDLAAAYSLTDAGAGVDTVSETASYATTDSGASSDEVGVVTVPVAGADTGSGTESAVLGDVTYSVTETGIGDDIVSETVPYAVTDSGSGSDSGAATVPISGTDTGSGEDASVLTVAYGLTEDGSGTDNVSLSAVASVSDSGALSSEQAVLVATYALNDSGASVDETTSLIAAIIVEESGTGADNSALETGTPDKTGSDSGSGAESTTLTADYSIQETGTGSDVLTLSVSISSVEAGSGVDNSSIVYPPVFATDTGSGIDTVSLAASNTVADIGAGVDSSAILLAALGVTEVGIGDESTLLSAVLDAIELGTGIDVSSVLSNVSLLPKPALEAVNNQGVGSTVVAKKVGATVIDKDVDLTLVLSKYPVLENVRKVTP